MANIDYQLLRDWYNSNYYTGIPMNIGSGRDKEARELRDFWKNYVQSRPIELDPRVKYRIANKEAIKQFDDTGKISGTTRYSGSEDIPAVFFSQGQPLHQYAAGALYGRGTSFSEQQPFLIATVGDNWGSSSSINNVTQDQINRYSLIDSVYDRVGEDAQGFVRESRWRLEDLKKQASKVKTVGQLNNILDRIEEIQSEFPNFASAIEKHLHGAPARGYYESGFPDFASYYGVEGWDDVLTKPDHFIPDNLFDLEILRDGYEARGAFDGDEKVLKSSRDYLVQDIDKALNGLRGIEDTFSIDPKKLKQFFPYPAGKFHSGRDMYAIPEWVKANANATSLLPSDTELMEKIAAGKATPEEVERVYGLGALEQWRGGGGNFKRLFIDNPNSKLLERVKHIIPATGASQGAMSSEVLPRAIIEDASNKPTWSITSPSVEVGNYRPFAIWQYTKNGLRLINQGNNEPVVGGVKPIPTDRVDSDLVRTSPAAGNAFRGRAGEGFIDFFGVGDKVGKQFNAGKYFQKWATQEELGQINVGEAVKKFGKLGWKRGFLDAGAVTKPFENLGRYMTEIPFPEVPAGAVVPAGAEIDYLATMRHNYLNNPEYRSALNASALGKLGTAAALVATPFDSINRRNAYEKYLVDNGATAEDLSMMRIPVGVASGLETAANFATFGLYDAFSPSVSAEANRQAAEDSFYRDLALRKYIQQGIDYPVIGGQRFERTTK